MNAGAIVKAWMDSPEHRANILNEEFTRTGVSVIFKDGKVYAAQEFFTPVENNHFSTRLYVLFNPKLPALHKRSGEY